ncbi:hypothetical protein IEI_00058 [Bacillus wiedmannii]|nr:hypothetical protein IEI_00058 [Bacillus wiedmannii]
MLFFSNIIRMSQTNMSMLYSSEIEFFQSVAAAIEKKDPSIIVNKDSNTHWKDWVEFDCD